MSKFDFQKNFPKLAAVKSDKEHPNRITLNNQKYLLSVWLDNLVDCMEIPVSNIEELEIIDDMLGFNQMGRIVYSTPNFSIERFFSKFVDNCDLPNTGQFIIQGTGTELVHVKLQLLPNSESEETANNISSDLIMQSFVITEIKDGGNPLSNKNYELKFEGIEKNVLENYRIENFVCGESSRRVSKKVLGGLNTYPKDANWSDRNNFQADKTGEAIYTVMLKSYDNWSKSSGVIHNLTDMLPDVKLVNVENSIPIFGNEQSVTKNNLLEPVTESSGLFKGGTFEFTVDLDKQKNNNKYWVKENEQFIVTQKNGFDIWDFGSESSFIYSQFVKNSSSWDIIDTFSKVHTSGYLTDAVFTEPVKGKVVENINKLDPCILKLERPVNENTLPQITYKPLVTYFQNVTTKNNGERYRGQGFMEVFKFAENESKNTLESIPNFLENTFCRTNGSNSDKPINNFYYEPASPTDANLFFKSYMATYNGKGKNEPNGFDGRFDLIKEYIGQNYIKPLYEYDNNVGIGWGHLVNIRDNGLKGADNILQTTYNNPETKSARIALGRNRGIMSFIFLNDALTFRVEGKIPRQSGMFFYATTFNVDKNDKVLNKMVGYYLCSSITHTLSPSNGKYTQDITGVKVYARPTKDDLVINTNNLFDTTNGVFV